MDGWPSAEGLDPPITLKLTLWGIFFGKEGLTLSSYETLSIVLMILAIVTTLLIALIENKK